MRWIIVTAIIACAVLLLAAFVALGAGLKWLVFLLALFAAIACGIAVFVFCEGDDD